MNSVFRKIVHTQSALYLIVTLLFSFLVFPVQVTGKPLKMKRKQLKKM